jgi:hypothetical protein
VDAALIFGLSLVAPPQAWGGSRARIERPRAVLEYEPGTLEEPQAQAFAGLLDEGVRDIESLLGPSPGAPVDPPVRVRYIVSERIGVSRAFRHTVLLPLERVRSRSAPYLHETVHVLVPSRSDCVWLNEGLASYLESRVSETIGGYDAHVFTQTGNAGIHSEARHHLDRAEGRDVLPYVGARGEPPRLGEDRARVARPFYVLAQSFVKYVVDGAGLGPLVRAARDDDPLAALTTDTGRSVDQWKRDWLAAITTTAEALPQP